MPSTTIKGQAKIVCGAKKCSGFKSQSKPKLPFAGKALPLVKGWGVGQNLNYYLLETMHQLIMVQPLLRRNVVLPRLQAPSGPVPIGHKKEAKWTQYLSITPNQVSDWT